MNVLHQHGPANPIIVDDDDEEGEVVEDSEVERWGEVDGSVHLSLELEGQLIPIKDEDPRDPSQEVNRAEEREELRHRHLTMDDQVWREVMEIEQLSRINLVPGYTPAPDYNILSHLDPSV